MRDRDAEIDEEMSEHVRLLTERNLASGMPLPEARRTARLAFGSLDTLKEVARFQRPWAWLSDVGRDVTYTVRALRTSPGFALVVVLTLVIGMGANAAVFNIANAVLLRPLPVRAPDELVLLADGRAGSYSGPLLPGRLTLFSYPLFERLRAQRSIWGDLAAQQSEQTEAVVRWAGGLDEVAYGLSVSGNYFGLLGVPAYRGRVLLPDDQTAPGANPVVVLSYEYWQRRFSGSSAVLSSTAEINGTVYTVVGVAARDFIGTSVGRANDFWVPLTMHGQLWRERDWLSRPQGAWLLPIGRLQKGVSAQAAEANANLVLQRFIDENPGLARSADRERTRIILEPGARGVSQFRDDLRTPLLALSAGAGLLLLLVCLNLSHLLLARSLARHREMSVRIALGAGRPRLIRQILVESLVVSALGAAPAVWLGRWLSLCLLAMVWTDGSSMALPLTHDVRTVAFSAIIALGCTVVLALVPGWNATRIDLQSALRSASPTVAGGGSRQRLTARLLLVSQVALSVILLVSAGLLVGTLHRLEHVDKGFDSQYTVLARFNTQMSGLEGSRGLAVYDDLLRRTAALPGVRAAALSKTALLEGFNYTRVSRPGTTTVFDSFEVLANLVTARYFETMGMTLVRGRDFTTNDNESAPRVAIVNEAFARRQYGSIDAVGRRFLIPRKPPQEFEVVGVVRDVRASGMRVDPPPLVYFAAYQEREPLSTLAIRTTSDPAMLKESLRQLLKATPATLPVRAVRTLDQQVQRSLAGDRIVATLATAFGLAALLLVGLGLYGVLSEWSAQRSTELAVRMALGATPARVRAGVLGEGLLFVGIGLGLGIPAAIAAARLAKSLLFDISPVNPPTLVLATLGLLLVAATAAFLPSWRASRLAPMEVLRHE